MERWWWRVEEVDACLSHTEECHRRQTNSVLAYAHTLVAVLGEMVVWLLCLPTGWISKSHCVSGSSSQEGSRESIG